MFISKFMPQPRRGSFVANTSGTAGLEFALIFPFAMLLLLGAIEVSRAVVMARRFNLLAATISDLVARDPMETDASFVGLKYAAETIWAPYDKATLALQVLNVRKSSTTTVKMAKSTDYVDWSKDLPIGINPLPAATYAKCTPYVGLPTNLLTPGTSTILVTASYSFKTLFGLEVPGLGTGQNWKTLSAHTPRNMCVYYNAPNCVPLCE
jgi:Flp pilus assembly protein TadG